jgi:multidrug efflux pump subunit AcrA (membrane-fusion protein)
MKQTTAVLDWVEPIEWSSSSPKALPEEVIVAPPPKRTPAKYSQSVSLRQSPFWSRAILWGLLGLISAALAWACLAQFEEAIPTQGQLKPQGAVKEVQSPVEGVVKAVYVKDGQRVKKGDRLLSLDPTTAKAQLTSLNTVRAALVQENQFYQMQLAGGDPLSDPTLTKLQISPAIAALTRNRLALTAENQMYRAQLRDSTAGLTLGADAIARIRASRAELDSRTNAAELETQQLRQQLEQAQIQLTDAKMTAAVSQKILSDIQPLMQEGAIARIQFLKQEQEANTDQANIERLTEEVARLQYAIAQSQAQTQTIASQFERDLRLSLAENDKQIAQIDSQLNKAIVENEKRMAEIDSQISQTNLLLKYQELVAPADGTVFDLQARSPGFVTQASQPILKVVPEDTLTAEVFITNQDIGFVQPGMKVDVRIDSFPHSEFGDIKGELVWIGSDALPPTETRPFYSFPAKIRLERQSIPIQQRDVLLQSGMSINANIKVRKRTVISIFSELFVKQMDSLTTVR